jgi:hypothetical protein
MNRSLNILLGGVLLLVALMVNVALSGPKNASTASPTAENPDVLLLDDLVGETDPLSGMDFGDPLSGGLPELENEERLLEATPETELSARPDYNALPEEELAGLKEFGAQLLRSLKTNDPGRLSALPPSVVDNVDAIIADPSTLTPDQTEALMQHFVDLGREGYSVNMVPTLPELEELEIVPFVPDIALPEPYVIDPFVTETPDLLRPNEAPVVAAPSYEDELNYYSGGGLIADPFARIGEDQTADFQFGSFFSLPFRPGQSFQVLRLEVGEAGLLASRFFFDSALHGSLDMSLHQTEQVSSNITTDDLISVAPGLYDFVITRYQIDRAVTMTARIDFREMRDQSEPNDLKAQAVPIDLPFRERLFLESKDDVDWLTFAVAEEGVLSVSGVDAGINILQSDDTSVPVSASSAGTRYAIIQPGTYFVRVEGVRFKRTGKVTLRFYPPSGLGRAINRLIGIGLENNAEVAGQMRAVSLATGAPLVETTETAEITAALDEVAGGGGGLSWIWFVVLGLSGLGVFVYMRRQRS